MDDLKLIKKYYGEDMMHLCRELFPTILETEGLLFKLLSDNFAYSKLLYDDINDHYMLDEFKDYIYSFIDVENNNEVITNKNPFELMSDAGYTLYECKTEEDIQSFKKYYAEGEKLCTFRGHRLDSCYVFFAVKNNVNEIKREDFENPHREDEYGTSVISIQFRRGEKNTVSIKNRYNHRVNNPDSTFHNNLDNIIPGLTKSFEKQYNLNISKESDYDFELPSYTMDVDGKYYRFNYEINNVYYGPNNVILDNFVEEENLDPAKILVLDYYLFDLEKKTIKCYDNSIVDTFPHAFGHIDKMEVRKIESTKNKELLIHHEGVVSTIVFDDYNKIRELDYKGNMTSIDQFMTFNRFLIKIKLENVTTIGNYFLNENELGIKVVDLPNAASIGNNCIQYAYVVASFKAPKVIKIGDNFLSEVRFLSEIDLSNLESIGINNVFENIETIKRFKISDKYKDILKRGKEL